MNSDSLKSRLHINKLVAWGGGNYPAEFSVVIGITIAVTGFLFVAAAILGLDLERDINAVIEASVLDSADFRPEPHEQAIYLTGLLFLPLVLMAWSYLKGPVLQVVSPRVRLCVTWGMMVPGLLLLVISSIVLSPSSSWDKSAYEVIGMTELLGPTWIHLSAVLVLAVFILKLNSALLVDLICLSLALLLASMTVLGENDMQSVSVHLQVLMSPHHHVLHGGTLLVDQSSQYGLHPHMLAPLFSIIGLTVETYSLVMSGFYFLSLTLLYVSMRKLISNLLVLTMGYVAMLGFVLGWSRFMGLTEMGLDPYFQYWPIRTLFPALAIFFVTHYSSFPGARTQYLGHILLSIGCLWNLDSGIPALGAWIAFLLYRATDVMTFVRRIIEPIVIFGAALLFSLGFLYFRAGVWPSLSMMVESQQVFAYAGFAMLPMPIFHPWNLVIGVYLAAFCWAANRWWFDKESDGATVFSLTILGCGLFSYYTGRSHDLVFPATVYPAFILVAIFLDRAVTRRQSAGPVTVIAGLAAGMMLLVFTVGMTSKLGTFSNLSLQRLALHSVPRMERTTWVIDMVTRYRKNSDSVLFLSDHATYWHLLTNTRAEIRDNLFTIFYQADIDEIAKTMAESNVPIFVDSYFSLPRKGPAHEVHQGLLVALREAGYRPQVYTPDRTFSFWARPE